MLAVFFAFVRLLQEHHCVVFDDLSEGSKHLEPQNRGRSRVTDDTALRAIVHVKESASHAQLPNTIATHNMSIDFTEMLTPRMKNTFEE